MAGFDVDENGNLKPRPTPASLNPRQFERQTAAEHDPEMDDFFAPLTSEQNERIKQRATGGDSNQRAGQMKRAYHAQERKSIADQNKPPPEPRAPRRAAAPRAANPLRTVKRFNSLARKARGHR